MEWSDVTHSHLQTLDNLYFRYSILVTLDSMVECLSEMCGICDAMSRILLATEIQTLGLEEAVHAQELWSRVKTWVQFLTDQQSVLTCVRSAEDYLRVVQERVLVCFLRDRAFHSQHTLWICQAALRLIQCRDEIEQSIQALASRDENCDRSLENTSDLCDQLVLPSAPRVFDADHGDVSFLLQTSRNLVQDAPVCYIRGMEVRIAHIQQIKAQSDQMVLETILGRMHAKRSIQRLLTLYHSIRPIYAQTD